MFLSRFVFVESYGGVTMMEEGQMMEKSWWRDGKQEKGRKKVRKAQQVKRKYRRLAQVLRGG